MADKEPTKSDMLDLLHRHLEMYGGAFTEREMIRRGDTSAEWRAHQRRVMAAVVKLVEAS